MNIFLESPTNQSNDGTDGNGLWHLMGKILVEPNLGCLICPTRDSLLWLGFSNLFAKPQVDRTQFIPSYPPVECKVSNTTLADYLTMTVIMRPATKLLYYA